MSSITDEWSDIHLDENNPTVEQNLTHCPNNALKRKHLQVMTAYLQLKSDPVWLQSVEVKATPCEMFEKHITPKPITKMNARDLAILRKRFGTKTHCFEDPQWFCYYPVAGGLWISIEPVTCYVVVPEKPSGQLVPRFIGQKWAIFEYTHTNPYHFNKDRWYNTYNLPKSTLGPKT